MDKLAQITIKLKWYIVLLVFALTVFFGFHIKDLRINSDIISSLPDDDPHAVLFKKIGEQFGGNNMGIIILEADDIFNTAVLQNIVKITDTLKEVEGINAVTSLTNIIDIKGGDFGIEIGNLIDEYDLPDTPDELKALRDRVMSKEMYRGTIISDDGTATLMIFTLNDEANPQTVARTVKDKVLDMDLPVQIYFTGSPMLVTYISDLMTSDLMKLLPIAFLLIAFILMLSFKTIRGVVLPLLTAIIAIVWTLGIMGLAGYEMSMISNNIPIILLAVGSAYTIHVLNRINQFEERDRKKAVITALSFIIIPVILAALTTMIGFVSFIFGAYLTMIKDFGIFTALGTFFTLLLSIFFVPAVIVAFSITSKKKEKIAERSKYSILSKNILIPLHSLLFKHPKYVLLVWSILIVLSVGGIFKIERSVDIKEYFKKGDPTRMAEEIMLKKFGGTKPVFVLFRGDMQSPEVLKMMIKTEIYMKESPDIKNTQSVANLIEEINDVMGNGLKIPDDRVMIEQLWFLLDGNDYMQRFVSDDLDEGIILSTFLSPDNKSKKVFGEYMDKFIKENSTDDCQIAITGMPFIDVTMDRSLVKSQFGSLTIAVIFVIIIVGLILRSFSSGIYAIIPIVVAITILFGFMGIAGISLNIGTVLVASVALGIGIDYSIHIISHFNHIYEQSNNLEKALEGSIIVSGKAILINAISVSAGFLVLLFSQIVPLQYFGLLIAFSMIGSSLGALTLLPVILILVKRRKL
jgi:predicted RND superfamily exporter protein